jgi:hypothetical protein
VVCLAPPQVEAIRAALLAKEKLYAATLVSLVAYQGLRVPEEVLALEVQHVRTKTLLVEQRNIAGTIVAGQKVRGFHPRAVDWVEPARRDVTEYLLALEGLRGGAGGLDGGLRPVRGGDRPLGTADRLHADLQGSRGRRPLRPHPSRAADRDRRGSARWGGFSTASLERSSPVLGATSGCAFAGADFDREPVGRRSERAAPARIVGA